MSSSSDIVDIYNLSNSTRKSGEQYLNMRVWRILLSAQSLYHVNRFSYLNLKSVPKRQLSLSAPTPLSRQYNQFNRSIHTMGETMDHKINQLREYSACDVSCRVHPIGRIWDNWASIPHHRSPTPFSNCRRLKRGRKLMQDSLLISVSSISSISNQYILGLFPPFFPLSFLEFHLWHVRV